MSILRAEKDRLVRECDGETLWIEAWGKDSLRIRASGRGWIDLNCPQALLPSKAGQAEIHISGEDATIVNGRITARIHDQGRLTVSDASGRVLVAERWRNRDVPGTTYSALNIAGRELRPVKGDMFRIALRLEAHDDEKFYGMGQYQDGRLNLKGSTLELAQRNSQASVPFVLSSRGYGLLWNNPAVGSASFAANQTEFVAETANQLDWWITSAGTPAEIVENYAAVTGTVPMMPDYAMGFWQCKLRYKTQEELLSVAREYKRRGLPLSVIVADFFHWPLQGDWKFDERYWPDPSAMVAELREMGVELMVSVWPTVDKRSANYSIMKQLGYLVRSERGVRGTMDFMGDCVFFDATHPGARAYIWDQAKTNYFSHGIKLFWLDEAEPEFTVYDFDNYRYHIGSTQAVGNIYPLHYAQAFYDGLRAEGVDQPLSLARCAWAGSQRYGALVWSGDIDTTWESFRAQLAAGLNMGIAGIPWWTTDIGGFGGGDPDDPAYRELFVRWFQWGAFCPVFRLHGFRVDKTPGYALMHPAGSTPEDVFSGGPNEVWSYGDEALVILESYLRLRERLRPYIAGLMESAHQKGTPVMRPLFHDFPADRDSWEVEDEYMFGPDVLVAPVLRAGQRQRSVYLPKGSSWRNAWTDEVHEGGQSLDCLASLGTLPLFLRDGAQLPIRE